MRKLLKITGIFALALVFSAGMAFGQSNEATVEQINNNNEATVDQLGQLNAADVNQGEDQKVTDLANTLSQNLLGYPVTPSGGIGPGTANNNQVSVEQQGTRNVVGVSQGYAGTTQGPGVAEGNEATITQIGSRNAAVPAQGLRDGRAFDNEYTILQDGSRNVATVAQGTDSGVARDNEANIEQFGSQHEALINQGRTSFAIGGGFKATNSLAEIFQNGSGNDATINQHN
jgi:hypothetical protein